MERASNADTSTERTRIYDVTPENWSPVDMAHPCLVDALSALQQDIGKHRGNVACSLSLVQLETDAITRQCRSVARVILTFRLQHKDDALDVGFSFMDVALAFRRELSKCMDSIANTPPRT